MTVIVTTTDTVEGTDIPSTDFNPMWGGPRMVGDSMAMYDRLRELHPSFIRSDQGPAGFWQATRGEIIREALTRPDVFSNWAQAWFELEPSFNLIPEYLDPPAHTKWRQLTSPYFSPGRVNSMEAGLRERARELVMALAPLGRCDYVRDFSQVFPTTVFLKLFGIPTTELRRFLVWEDEILHSPATDEGYGMSARAMGEVTELFVTLIEEKRRNPGDDVISAAVTWKIDEKPISDEDLLAFALLMFMAGLDTITNELAYATWHFATHDSDRHRLVDDPAVVDTAIEEVLRFYPIVTPGRRVTRDIDFHGCPMKQGDVLCVPIVVANRDPQMFGDADKFIIDRGANPHLGFGAGPHRCLGSNVARREMRLALEEWHKVIPHYRTQPGADAFEHIGVQLGVANLPIEWDV